MSNEHLKILQVRFNHEGSPYTTHNHHLKAFILLQILNSQRFTAKQTKQTNHTDNLFIGKKSIQLNLHPKSCPIHTGPNLNVTKCLTGKLMMKGAKKKIQPAFVRAWIRV
jgi:hypothetical protein